MHEEFKLRLAKERDVDLAAIHVQNDIAQAHSNLVGEALKHAHIDIVGGENDFFEKIVRSVGTGKSVDRLLQNSRTLTEWLNVAIFDLHRNGSIDRISEKWFGVKMFAPVGVTPYC